jgi:hypothetical protein
MLAMNATALLAADTAEHASSAASKLHAYLSKDRDEAELTLWYETQIQRHLQDKLAALQDRSTPKVTVCAHAGAVINKVARNRKAYMNELLCCRALLFH